MQILESRLEKNKIRGLHRTLQARRNNVDFCSNDYLGFAEDSVLRTRFLDRLHRNVPLGAAGSRLLYGNLTLYEETENILAEFVQREAALLFSSGFMANVALLSSLLAKDDIVFSDQLNHASIIDGIKLSRADKIIFPHCDYNYLEEQLQKNHKRQTLKLIVTESVFSMEGSGANLHLLAELAERYSALLIVDEAHSTGLWGESLVATLGLTQKVFATTHTAGKALGASGAWIAGNHLLRDYMINFARGFIFSTAPVPVLAIMLEEAIRFFYEVGRDRAIEVRKKSQYFRELIRDRSPMGVNDSPIISLVIGDNQKAVKMSQYLQKKSWNISAIRPPTVPDGSARLRITIKWKNTWEQIEQLANDVRLAQCECGIKNK